MRVVAFLVCALGGSVSLASATDGASHKVGSLPLLLTDVSLRCLLRGVCFVLASAQNRHTAHSRIVRLSSEEISRRKMLCPKSGNPKSDTLQHQRRAPCRQLRPGARGWSSMSDFPATTPCGDFVSSKRAHGFRVSNPC